MFNSLFKSRRKMSRSQRKQFVANTKAAQKVTAQDAGDRLFVCRKKLEDYNDWLDGVVKSGHGKVLKLKASIQMMIGEIRPVEDRFTAIPHTCKDLIDSNDKLFIEQVEERVRKMERRIAVFSFSPILRLRSAIFGGNPQLS